MNHQETVKKAIENLLEDQEGFKVFMKRYVQRLAIEQAAITNLKK